MVAHEKASGDGVHVAHGNVGQSAEGLQVPAAAVHADKTVCRVDQGADVS
jgi:hypothetical protein